MRIQLQNAWTYSELVFLYKTKDVNFNFTQNYKKKILLISQAIKH